MIFFSDDIKNKIIDDTPIEEILDKLEQFKEDQDMIFTYFNYGTIAIDYIQNLLKYESNKRAFYCLEDNFVIRKCPSCMIYSKQNKKNSDTIIYYIMVISTQQEFRNKGYGTALLNGFIERIKLETQHSPKKVKIVLSSLDEVVSYYQKYGFEVTDCSFDNYPYLKAFEIYDDEKIYTIMELNIAK
jgi:ribosomal protein S18 acetylase RimI-like enzyme